MHTSCPSTAYSSSLVARRTARHSGLVRFPAEVDPIIEAPTKECLMANSFSAVSMMGIGFVGRGRNGTCEVESGKIRGSLVRLGRDELHHHSPSLKGEV